MTLNMPGAERCQQVLTGSPWPSDHNLVLADVTPSLTAVHTTPPRVTRG